jgi:outer membrane protein X
MKKIVFILLQAVFISFIINAQDTPLKIEAGILYSYTRDNPPFKTGFGFYLHPSYLVNENIGLGIKAEVIEAGIENTQGNLTSVSAMHSYLAIANYYISSNKVRPYIGFGVGVYNLSILDSNEDGNLEEDFKFEFKFGFAPKVGVDIGHFTISVAYNWIYGPIPDIAKIDYFSVSIGSFLGGKAKVSKRNRIISIEDDEDF